MDLNLRLFNEIENALVELIERQAAEIVTGRAVDWADYRGRAQYLKGLRDALEVSREAQARVLGVDDKEY